MLVVMSSETYYTTITQLLCGSGSGSQLAGDAPRAIIRWPHPWRLEDFQRSALCLRALLEARPGQRPDSFFHVP
jgi:hypothetical protein